MELNPTEKLEKIFKNRYEAVIMVAKHARRLNIERTKADSPIAQISGEEKSNPKDEEKVINQALREAMEGKIKFNRREEKSKSDLRKP